MLFSGADSHSSRDRLGGLLLLSLFCKDILMISLNRDYGYLQNISCTSLFDSIDVLSNKKILIWCSL